MEIYEFQLFENDDMRFHIKIQLIADEFIIQFLETYVYSSLDLYFVRQMRDKKLTIFDLAKYPEIKKYLIAYKYIKAYDSHSDRP